MFELIKPYLQFLWDFVNIPFHVGDITFSFFNIFAFSAITGTLIKLIFGGGYRAGNND